MKVEEGDGREKKAKVEADDEESSSKEMDLFWAELYK